MAFFDALIPSAESRESERLFDALVEAHGLDRSDVRLLLALADRAKVVRAAEVFVRPGLFTTSPDRNAWSHREVRQLAERLFSSAENSLVADSPVPSADPANRGPESQQDGDGAAAQIAGTGPQSPQSPKSPPRPPRPRSPLRSTRWRQRPDGRAADASSPPPDVRAQIRPSESGHEADRPSEAPPKVETTHPAIQLETIEDPPDLPRSLQE